MELLQLKYFCDAAETQNFSRTAKKFLVPTSNISQTIKRLEKELETPLFERQANRIKLNDSGLFFYKNAKSALDLLESAENSLKQSRRTEMIRINIHITRRVVMEAIEEFRKKYPDTYFITAHSADDYSDKFDIIVTDKELDLPYLKTKVAEECFLLAYNKNKFVFNDNISAELARLPFITMGSGSSIYDGTKRMCNNLGVSPHIVLQSEDPFYIRECIELGLGIAIVPELSWRGQFSNDIVLKNIGEDKRSIYVYKKYGIDGTVNSFCSMLIEKYST